MWNEMGYSSFQAIQCHISGYFRCIFDFYAVRICLSKCRMKLTCLVDTLWWRRRCVSGAGGRVQGYRPTVFSPRASTKHAVYSTLATQCEKADIPSLLYLPSDAQLVADSYSLVVDAIFGVGFEPPMSSDFAAIVQTITRSRLPVVSIDVPSGLSALSVLRSCHCDAAVICDVTVM